MYRDDGGDKLASDADAADFKLNARRRSPVRTTPSPFPLPEGKYEG